MCHIEAQFVKAEDISTQATMVGRKAWLCPKCGAYSLCKPGTATTEHPLRTLSQRKDYRSAFKLYDKLWRKGYMANATLNSWMSRMFQTLSVMDLSIAQLRTFMAAASIYIDAKDKENANRK